MTKEQREPSDEVEAPKLAVSIEEVNKTYKELRKRSWFWTSALFTAVASSIAASYLMHPAAGVLMASLYGVLFTHGNLYKVSDALKHATQAREIFNSFGEEAVNSKIAEQMGIAPPPSDSASKPSGQYL